jgi:pimeloyl-ACP methyl ester carboxylesterase
MMRDRLTIHGHDLSFVNQGEGPVLVLLHGMAGSCEAWKRVVPSLARDFTLVVPDLLGHGESAKPLAEYSISGHANVLRDLLAALGHERATLVGQSFGGGVAMQFAYQYPEQCERLVLVSSGGLGREVSPLLRALSVPGVEQVFPLFCSPPLRDAGRRVLGWLGALGLHPAPAVEETWRSYASLAEGDARRAFFRTLQSVIDTGGQSVSATDRLYLAAHVPTLILWGDRDPIIPVSHALATHAAIPDSRLEIFDGVGHFPHCEAPERFVEALVGFIRSSAPAEIPKELRGHLLRRGATPPTPRGRSTTVAEGLAAQR